jgi:hypothetical protein
MRERRAVEIELLDSENRQDASVSILTGGPPQIGQRPQPPRATAYSGMELRLRMAVGTSSLTLRKSFTTSDRFLGCVGETL